MHRPARRVKVVHMVIGGEVAGGQLVALELARAARHEVSFVCPAPGDFVRLAEGEGFRTRVVPLGGTLDLRSLLRLRAVLRDERADVLHTHEHFSLKVLGRVAGRLTGARVVAHMHIGNVFRAGRVAHAVQVALHNATARLCTAIVAVSEDTRAALADKGYPDGVVVVRNGVRPAPPAEPRRPDGLVADARLLLHVGRLAPVKGQGELIDALARMERGDAVAVLAGKDLEAGGAYQRELEGRAEQRGVGDRVVFAGYREDVAALLAAADVFVLPPARRAFRSRCWKPWRPERWWSRPGSAGRPRRSSTGKRARSSRPATWTASLVPSTLCWLIPTRRGGSETRGGAASPERFSAAAMSERVLALYVA